VNIWLRLGTRLEDGSYWMSDGIQTRADIHTVDPVQASNGSR
jgi:hypothetical protein